MAIRTSTILLLSLAGVAAAGALAAFKNAPPATSKGTTGVVRLAPAVEVRPDDKAIKAVVERLKWTEFGDYGTVRIGRIERPARLLTGHRRWVRRIVVPPGGARYEATVGAIDGAVAVRVGHEGAGLTEMQVRAGNWTRIALDLDPRDGARQSVSVDVEIPPAAVAAWSSELVALPPRADRPPDVILISLDTVRRDQIAPYATSAEVTPTLAALAREAVVFGQAISTSSWTIASHATLFTGRFPADSLGYDSRISSDEMTLAKIFAIHGYRTFGISGGPYTDPRWGFQQGFDEFVVSGDRENARDATDRAIEWMRHAGTAPVFVFLNYFNAHEPLELSAEVRRASGITEDVPAALWWDVDAGRREVTPDVRQRLARASGAEVAAIDAELRRLFQYLHQDDRWNRTIVIAWSDHGQLLGERGFIGHAYTLDEELIRVPLLIKGAAGGGLRSGTYDAPIQNDDLFALSQSLAGLPSAEGDRIRRAIADNSSARRHTFSKIHHEPLGALTQHRRWRSATQWAVRDGRTKIVLDREGRVFAYDVTGREERPIPAPGRDSPLVSVLHRFQSWSAQAVARLPVGPLSPEQLERLRALGYLR